MFSEPSNAAGKYVSFFPASDLTEADPVEFAIQAAVGRTSYTTGREESDLQAAEQRRPRPQAACLRNVAMPLPVSTAVPGAIYRGTLVGVSAGTGVVRPISATWPDAKGRFQLDPAGVGRGQDAALLAERLPDLPDDRRRPPAARSTSRRGRRRCRPASRATPASCGSRLAPGREKPCFCEAGSVRVRLFTDGGARAPK